MPSEMSELLMEHIRVDPRVLVALAWAAHDGRVMFNFVQSCGFAARIPMSEGSTFSVVAGNRQAISQMEGVKQKARENSSSCFAITRLQPSKKPPISTAELSHVSPSSASSSPIPRAPPPALRPPLPPPPSPPFPHQHPSTPLPTP